MAGSSLAWRSNDYQRPIIAKIANFCTQTPRLLTKRQNIPMKKKHAPVLGRRM
jgi:hypothetical protein